MPIWLRNFTYKQIVNNQKEEQNQINQASGDSDSTSTKIGDSKIPNHMREALTKGPRKPSYKTKTSKK